MLFSRLWPLFISCFFLVAGYEFIRSPSVSLFQAAYSPSATPYLMVMLPVFSFSLLYLYGRILTRFGPRRTFSLTALASGVGTFLLEEMIHVGWGWATGLLFLFRETYIVIVLEQMWSLLDSIINEEEAKSVNAWFTALTSIGSIGAGFMVGALAVKWGTLAMLNLGALTFLPTIWFMNLCYRKNETRIVVTELKKENVSHTTGFQYFEQYQVLRYLFLISFIAQLVSTTTGLHFQEKLHSSFPNTDTQTAYSGNFYAIMNIGSMLFQMALAPFLLRRISPPVVQLLVPLVQIGFAVIAWQTGTLLSVSLLFGLFKSLDYSLYRSSKEILFIALPFDVRYRTKGWIDVIGYRTAKGVGSVGFAVLGYLGFTLSNWYGSVALVCFVIWTYVAFRLVRSQRKVT
ncbi:MAG: MFS transporter [Xanthomonadaceae bacterium]|nr:MFS transporter [Xanthomonadaceae bacterium]